MLNFLRFGRTGFLAALGEIALIVIGILLALQIDQWNADRVDRQKEIEYLSSIGDGLRDDIEQLEWLIEFNDSKQKDLQKMMELLESGLQGTELSEKLTPVMGTITHYNFFKANQIAFDNLKSTHSLALIGNSDLQRALTEYYASERGLIGTSEHLESWTRALGPLVASQTVHARWFDGFPEFAELPDDFQLPMRSVEEVRLDVTPELGVNLFYVGLLNEAQRREFALELEAAQSLLELVAARYEQLNQ